MGAIQNAVNAALGGAARAATAGVAMQSLKAEGAAKAIENKASIEDAAKKEIEDVNKATIESEAADREAEAAKENYDYTKNNEVVYFGDDVDKQYQAKLEYENDVANAKGRLDQANNKAEKLKETRRQQMEMFERRKEIITKRVDAYNKTARRYGLEKINTEKLFKGGKK